MSQVLASIGDRKTTAKQRAAIERLRKAFEKMPENYFFYSTGDSFYVMEYGPDGFPMNKANGGYDEEYVVASFWGRHFEGGDW